MWSFIKPCMIISSIANLPDKRYFCGYCKNFFHPTWPSVVAGRRSFPFCNDLPQRQTHQSLPAHCDFSAHQGTGKEKRGKPSQRKICWELKYILLGPTVQVVSCWSCISYATWFSTFHPDVWKTSPKALAVKDPGCHFCPGSATGFEHCQGWPVLRSRTCEVQSKHLFSEELFLLSI